MLTHLKSPVAFVAGALICCAASAQTEITPNYYMWLPEPAAPWTHNSQFEPLVRVDVRYLSAQAAATLAVNLVQQRQAAGTLDAGRLDILLYGFGRDWPGDMSQVSFFDNQDSLTITEQWPDNSGSDEAIFTGQPYRHPWSNVARVRLAQWMEDFCSGYANAQGVDPSIPSPDRFTFDMEAVISGCCDPNYVFLLSKMSQDSRWSTFDIPGYPAGTTMATLYDAARSNHPDWNWPVSIGDPNTGLAPTQGASSDRNRQFMLWYYAIAQRARDAIMHDVAYQYIHAKWPNCKVSNDSDTNTDGVADTTGWFTDPTATQNPVNQFPRLRVDPGDPGALLYRENSGRWLTSTGVCTADLQAPEFYLSNQSHERENWYRLNAPTETVAEASLRDNRLWAESIINGAHGMNNDTLTPWLPMAFDTALVSDSGNDREIGGSDLLNLLLMLRGKNLAEANFWAGDVEITNSTALRANWERTEDTVRKVYAAHINNPRTYRGTLLTPGNEIDRLMFSLRDSGGQERTWDILSDQGQTELVVKFVLDDFTDATGLLLHLECSVDEPDVTGQVSLYNFVRQRWDAMLTTPDRGIYYGFYTPDYSARQDFVTLPYCTSQFVGPQNVVILKFDQVCPTGGCSFTSRYDLIQIVPQTGICGDLCCDLLQSDYNLDKVVDDADASEFIDDWEAGKKSADFNGDGVVDQADLDKFLYYFFNGQ